MKDMDILNFWKSLFVMGVLGGASFGGLLVVLCFYGAISGTYAVCGIAAIVASVMITPPVIDIFDMMEDSIRRDSLRHI